MDKIAVKTKEQNTYRAILFKQINNSKLLRYQYLGFFLLKLDGVGPVNNRPSPDYLHLYVIFFLSFHVTCDN